MSQEWRYFSRQKSLVHTLHLAQLADGYPGDTVLIANTAPEKNVFGGGWAFPPMQVPGGMFGGDGSMVTNTNMTTDCYGSVAYDGAIIAQNKMTISVGPTGDTEKIITFIPAESGFFLVHVEGQSELHTLGNQGVANDGKITAQIFLNGVGGSPVAYNDYQVLMSGADWNGLQYLDSILRVTCETIVYAGGPIIGRGLNMGSSGWLSMWAMKIAE